MSPRRLARLSRCTLAAALLAAPPLWASPGRVVTISVNTLGQGTFTGPFGSDPVDLPAFARPVSAGTPPLIPSPLVGVAAADPGPGGLASVLTYPLQNPPSLVFGDVQLTGPNGVTELIRFNAAGTGNPNYAASLLFYSSPTDGVGHLVTTLTPPGTLYPNVVSVPLGTVYTPGPGEPGYVTFVETHYIFNAQPCSYSIAPDGVNVSATGGSGSFQVTTSQGCPIAPVVSSDFLSFTVDGFNVDYTVQPNPGVEGRTGTITVGGQIFTVGQFGFPPTVTPSQLTFTSPVGTAPLSQTVTLPGAQGSLSVSVNVPWVTATLSSPQLPATLTVTVNPSGLAPGSYSATITLNVNGTTMSFVVQYVVKALPSLVAIPAQMTFNYFAGAAPASQPLQIYSTSAVAFQAAGGGFASVTPGSGTTTQSLTVSVDPSGLAVGAYSATITLTASGITNSPLTIPVKLNVFSTGPLFTSAGLVNAASFLAGPMAPGSLFSLFGTGLADGQPSERPDFQAPSMTIAGIPVPLQFVSPLQINAQVPFEVAPGQQPLTLTVKGISTTAQLTIVPAAPAIFLINGRGAILNQDFSLNTAANPAASGSTVQVFFTGQGLVTPPVATGAPAPATVSLTNAITTATIGNLPAAVVFSGLAPGMIGLGQANVEVPSLPADDYPLVLTVNGIASNSVIVAVKAP
jgi:uncharacterized protein (TIGR03437 family)